jgi:hypothetical protein
MKVFISWSGERSKAVAEALRDWLPSVIQAVRPWVSGGDIDKGARWRAGLADELEASNIGIICLTSENLTSPWLLFEAGALSKLQKNTYVCTLLLDLEPSRVIDPLAQFQCTKVVKDDMRKLVRTINKSLNETALTEAMIDKAFDRWWPELEERLRTLPPPEQAIEIAHRRYAEELVRLPSVAEEIKFKHFKLLFIVWAKMVLDWANKFSYPREQKEELSDADIDTQRPRRHGG